MCYRNKDIRLNTLKQFSKHVRFFGSRYVLVATTFLTFLLVYVCVSADKLITGGKKLKVPELRKNNAKVSEEGKDEPWKYNRIEQDRVYQPSERCKVIYNCSSALMLPVSYCSGEMEDRLVLLKFFAGHVYIGMKEQNKYVKYCVTRGTKRFADRKYRILDPVDRAKRFLVIIQSVVREILAENNRTVIQKLEKSVLALDMYDIPTKERASPGVTKLVGAPFSNSAKNKNRFCVTIPFTKLNYALSAKNGISIKFFDDTYETLRHTNFTPFYERKDQMLFTGQIKETLVGYRYGRKSFDKLAKMDSKVPADFVSNSKAPYHSFAKQAEYKFILSLSGAGAWTFFRTYGFLLGSLMFCQDAPQELWYYDRFKAMIHYVPVQEDLSDIEQKLQWARDNPIMAAAIAAEGRTLAIEVFDPKVILYEFKKRIIQGLLQDQQDDNYGELAICKLSVTQFCKGPEVCKKCVPSKV